MFIPILLAQLAWWACRQWPACERRFTVSTVITSPISTLYATYDFAKL
jgi:hypothetical protein